MKETNNSDNIVSDVYFLSECILALGRLYPEDDDIVPDNISLIKSQMTISESFSHYEKVLISGHISLTAICLRFPSIFVPEIEPLREIVLQNESLELRIGCFKCLLYLSLFSVTTSQNIVQFSDLISDLKKLCKRSEREVVCSCLQEISRLIHNSVPIGSGDKFESFLLSVPASRKPEDIAKDLTSGTNAIEICETLWSILTIDSKYDQNLRSACLRAYLSLYGNGLPHPYQTIQTAELNCILTAERSINTVLNIDQNRKATNNTKKKFMNNTQISSNPLSFITTVE